MTIKGDSLVEQLFGYAKKGLFANHQERELIERAAMRIQTLQAEKNLEKEGVEPICEELMGFEKTVERAYLCGKCKAPIDRMDLYCRRCGKRVQWTEVL